MHIERFHPGFVTPRKVPLMERPPDGGRMRGNMIIIRRMQPEDVFSVSRIEQETFSIPWSRRGFLDALKLDHTRFFVAEEERQIAGYIGMYLSLEEGEITNVAVAENARRKGIGGLLLSEIKKEAERCSVSRILLEVRVSNQAAISLYERNGFQICGTRKDFYQLPREDAYIMVCGQ